MIQAPAEFSVTCPSCQSEFPVDPAKVPSAGIHAICSTCQRVFRVEVPAEIADQPTDEATATFGDATGIEDTSVPGDEDERDDAVVAAAPDVSSPTALDDDAPAAEAGELEGAEVEEPGAAEAAEVEEPEAAEEVEQEEPEAREPSSPPDDDAGDDVGFEDLTTLTSEAMADEDLDDQLAGSALSLAADRFGKRDPGERAKRLARVLVSDIIAYYPARYRDSFAQGTVKEDFEDEVKKSWKEYVDQVGLEVAESTPHFDNALNEILGKGEKIF